MTGMFGSFTIILSFNIGSLKWIETGSGNDDTGQSSKSKMLKKFVK
jgi:hypothetical protein